MPAVRGTRVLVRDYQRISTHWGTRVAAGPVPLFQDRSPEPS